MSEKNKFQYETNVSLKKPKMYAVVMHNDDYTTMDFVVDILLKIFGKNENEAVAIMLEVHQKGKSMVNVYTYDIANTKKMQAIGLATQKGFPLKITVEEVFE